MNKRNNNRIKKLAAAGVLTAVGVVCSAFSIPVGASKCAPVQHMINVLAAVLLGPYYGVMMAFATSLIRNMLGLGSLMAFPGSMAGAFLSGIAYKYTKKNICAYAGELFGTSILGGLLAYPVAVYAMGREAALFAYVLPFMISSAGGTAIAAVIITSLSKTGVLKRMQA